MAGPVAAGHRVAIRAHPEQVEPAAPVMPGERRAVVAATEEPADAAVSEAVAVVDRLSASANQR